MTIAAKYGGGGGTTNPNQVGAIPVGGASEPYNPYSKKNIMGGTGYKYGELTDPLQRQMQAVQASGDEEQVKAFQQSLGSMMSQQEQLAPYAKLGAKGAKQMGKYAKGGMRAFNQQQALLGLRGADAMNEAYQMNPAQQFAQQQAEKSMLRNRATTGGLGDEGVQASLARLTSGLTNQNIQSQLGQLGGMAARGQQASGNMLSTGYDASGGLANIYGTGQADVLGMAAGAHEQAAARNASKGYGAALAGGLGTMLYGKGGGMVGGALGGAFDDAFSI